MYVDTFPILLTTRQIAAALAWGLGLKINAFVMLTRGFFIVPDPGHWP
jgi:hypothetical protein